MKLGFGECTKCNVWGDIPVNFNESKHFLKCPLCKEAMYLVRTFKPSDVGLNESKKVEITEFISHRG